MARAGTPPVPLLETCRLVAGRIPLLRYHRARLADGGCGADVLEAADAAMLAAASAWDGPASSRLRLTVSVSADGTVDAKVERRLSSLDVPGGPRVAIVGVTGPPALPPGAAKPADRWYWEEAQRRARSRGGDIALLVTPDGLLLDGGTCTVWLVVDGTIVTPVAPPAIAGVARAFLLDALAGAGTPARTGAFPASWLDHADEVFLTNAFGGVVCVRDRGPGPVFERVSEIFEGMWNG